MEFKKTEIAGGVRISIVEDKQELARAFLYLLKNDLHLEPFGLMEDVFVQDEFRGKGLGTQLVKELIQEARRRGCYKLICTSRHSKPQVHQWYEQIGFKNQGIEFRLDF